MSPTLEFVLAFWVTFFGLCAVIGVFYWRSRFSSEAKMRKRTERIGHPVLDVDSDTGEHYINRKLIQNKLKELESKRSKNKSNSIRQLILQSGIPLTTRKYLAISLISGLFTTGVLWLTGLAPFAWIMGGLAGGIALPRWVLLWIIKRRQARFITNFADSVDILIRGTRSGLPVGECLKIIARDAPEPIGSEFRLLTESQYVGMTLKQSLTRTLERMPITELQFFSIVLLIQQQTGGNLAATLENLANILRARKRFLQKIAALSAEAKASAGIIGSLPFFATIGMLIFNPEYIKLLFSEQLGHILIGFGVVWMVMGIVIMRQMIRFNH